MPLTNGVDQYAKFSKITSNYCILIKIGEKVFEIRVCFGNKERGCFLYFGAVCLPMKVRPLEAISQTQVDVVISVEQFCGLVR
jgi:hypothetical protein